MPNERRTIASPLTLLVEAATAGSSFDEALFLSFNADLGFFEAAALAPARALGARVTVVGDVAMMRYDPRAATRAGRSYVSGCAATQGAFHPKLVALTGPDTAIVAVGSGNVTAPGWGSNDELWTVVTVPPEGEAPQLVTDVARWLSGLPAAVNLAAGVTEAFERAADQLSSLPTSEVPGPRLVSSLTAPIISQLPAGPTDELCVYAPFHDPNASALAALVERFDPARLTVAVQPGLTVADGARLDDVVTRHGGAVIANDATRYRHGKLVEWAVGDRRFALTGSANCSSAALLRSVADGGNVELGVVSELDASLMPPGDALARAELRAHRYRPQPVQRPRLTVLGAMRTEVGVQVQLTRPAPPGTHVEISPFLLDPDVWEARGPIATEATVGIVTGIVEGGSRVRVVCGTGEDRLESNVVPVIDLRRAVKKLSGRSRYADKRPDDLFTDGRLADMFAADLAALRDHLPTPAAPAARPSSPSDARRQSRKAWEDYLDECEARLGPHLVNFALGVTAMPGDVGSPVVPEWREDPDDDGDLVDPDDEPDDVIVVPAVPRLRPSERARYRRWVTRLADLSPQLGPAEQLIVLRLVLWGVAGGAWPASDRSWTGPLTVSLCALAEGELPEPAEEPAGSLAAVVLAVLRSQIPRHRTSDETRLFDRTVTRAGFLLTAASPRYVAEYSQRLFAVYGPAVDVAHVMSFAAAVVTADPVTDAVDVCADAGIGVHAHGSVLHVDGTPTAPEPAALEALAAAQDVLSPVAVWATGTSGWTLIVWRRPDAVVATSTPRGLRWRHYRLPTLSSPRSELVTERRLNPDHGQGDWWPGVEPGLVVAELLAAAGLDTPEPPQGCA